MKSLLGQVGTVPVNIVTDGVVYAAERTAASYYWLAIGSHYSVVASSYYLLVVCLNVSY